jgi:hypothetical protein
MAQLAICATNRVAVAHPTALSTLCFNDPLSSMSPARRDD